MLSNRTENGTTPPSLKGIAVWILTKSLKPVKAYARVFKDNGQEFSIDSTELSEFKMATGAVHVLSVLFWRYGALEFTDGPFAVPTQDLSQYTTRCYASFSNSLHPRQFG